MVDGETIDPSARELIPNQADRGNGGSYEQENRP
jgi:hypothetical protein